MTVTLTSFGPDAFQVLGATSEDTSEYYEKGLLAPGVNYDAPPPYLRSNCDALDDDGHAAPREIKRQLNIGGN